jgi:hypothetical protein
MAKWISYVTFCVGFCEIFSTLNYWGAEWAEPGISWKNFRSLIGLFLITSAIFMQSRAKAKRSFACFLMILILALYWVWYFFSVQFLKKQVELLFDAPKLYGPHFGVLSNATIWDWIVLIYCVILLSLCTARILITYFKDKSACL